MFVLCSATSRRNALLLHGNVGDSDILSQGIAAVVLADASDHNGAHRVHHEWCSGQTKWHVCALIRPPYTCAQCNRYMWCTHCGGCAFCLTTTGCSARGGVTRDTDRWVHHPADREPTTPPIIAHGNGSKRTPMVRTPAQPKKPHKVRSRADTSVPPTTCTTCSGRRKKRRPPKDGGYLSEGDSTHEERYTKNDPTP